MTHTHIDLNTNDGSTSDTRRIPPPPPRRPSTDTAAAVSATPDDAPADEHSSTVMITPWHDPIVDDAGHDPRSLYVERFWLGVLGPTATWLVRRLTADFAEHPNGYALDLGATARAMGLSYSAGRSSPFTKALQRCTMFGLAHQTSEGLAVRRRIPAVAHRHLRRMPAALQAEHAQWELATVTDTDFVRAHTLAVAMLDAGDALEEIEHQLIAIGVAPAIAAQAGDNAARLERS